MRRRKLEHLTNEQVRRREVDYESKEKTGDRFVYAFAVSFTGAVIAWAIFSSVYPGSLFVSAMQVAISAMGCAFIVSILITLWFHSQWDAAFTEGAYRGYLAQERVNEIPPSD